MSESNNRDAAYELVTEAILAELANGVAPWRKPWRAICSGALRASGEEYQGINQFLLSLRGSRAGYSSRLWITFNQARKWGGAVRKGEKSSPVVFWKFLQTKERDEKTGEVKQKTIPLLRYYRVFNVEQCDNVETPAALAKKIEAGLVRPADPNAEAEKVCSEYLAKDGPRLTWTPTDRACYSPVRDHVTMPVREQFETSNGLYGTLFHELGHSTGHSSRLDRGLDKVLAPFGSEDYSREELVAELTSAFVLAKLGTDPEVPLRASYFQSWQKVFEDDKRAMVWAASRAEKASNLILGVEKAASKGAAETTDEGEGGESELAA